MSKPSSRNTRLDVIRCIALFFVVAIHFSTRSGFLSEPVDDIPMLIMIIVRSFFYPCIPLFLFLSGYLLCDHKPTPVYYLRAIRLLFIYLCASILFICFRSIYSTDRLSILNSILGILSYTLLDYGWYTEMYLGLFLLIPFLNVLYHSLSSKQNKQWLILTFLILTAFPSILNIYRFDNALWWGFPSISTTYQKIFPQWWVSLYPITHYLIGCYLKEYSLPFTPSKNFLLFLSFTIFLSFLNIYRSTNIPFVPGEWQNWGSAFITVQSIFLFSFLLQLPWEHLPSSAKNILFHFSNWSFGAYLISCMYDQIAYAWLIQNVPIIQQRFPYMIIIVPTVFLASLYTSSLFSLLYRLTADKFVRQLRLKILCKLDLKNEQEHCNERSDKPIKNSEDF